MTTDPTSRSPFLHKGTIATNNSLAVLHLRRDQLLPIILHETDKDGTGYAEGHVENTRFGSYPHSTLIGLPWGSQVIASKVDTGSRGRKAGHKRKRGENGDKPEDDMQSDSRPQKNIVAASSGFCHIVPPTPEAWTVSLPHRTQVVYTPDYSYILQKMRVRPGCVVIEAGAGSGSFTHAAARAVFDGQPRDSTPRGQVCSFEYHEPRAQQLRTEISQHGLESLVRITHRDVYTDGFCLTPDPSPLANRIFLDLPAPWQALPHLTRRSPSPLDPGSPVHICCFLPCIEQVQRCTSALRAHGWLEISMHALAHRRLEVRRERVGLDLEGLHGVRACAASVEESVARLREVETRGREFRGLTVAAERESKAARLERLAREEAGKKTWREGRLVHRTEPDLKSHTSYLVFAVLPQEWSVEDERRAREALPIDFRVDKGEKKKKKMK